MARRIKDGTQFGVLGLFGFIGAAWGSFSHLGDAAWMVGLAGGLVIGLVLIWGLDGSPRKR